MCLLRYLKAAHVAWIAGVLQAVLIALHEELEEVPVWNERVQMCQQLMCLVEIVLTGKLIEMFLLYELIRQYY